MKVFQKILVPAVISLLFLASCKTTTKQADSYKSLAPHLSQNARILLEYMYEISGQKTLTGQHNYMGKLSLASDSLYKLTGKYPAVWGSDFGFSDGGIDDMYARPALVKEIIKQHKLGSIITITYHQASPTVGEPCEFKSGVQAKITDADWNDILSPGTELYVEWKRQMDLIAGYLLQIKEAGIPVLFRPYHEMNGAWFWWGASPGEDRYIALWKQLYELYTEEFKLDNLIWVWSPDDPDHGLEGYYPGDEYVDMVSCDLYHYGKTGPVYDQEDYERIRVIAPNKPLGVGESSEIPTDSILGEQPLWTWFMTWENHIFNRNSAEKIRAVYHSERFITRDEIPDFNYNN